jgi:hypothetical protein
VRQKILIPSLLGCACIGGRLSQALSAKCTAGRNGLHNAGALQLAYSLSVITVVKSGMKRAGLVKRNVYVIVKLLNTLFHRLPMYSYIKLTKHV